MQSVEISKASASAMLSALVACLLNGYSDCGDGASYDVRMTSVDPFCRQDARIIDG